MQKITMAIPVKRLVKVNDIKYVLQFDTFVKMHISKSGEGSERVSVKMTACDIEGDTTDSEIEEISNNLTLKAFCLVMGEIISDDLSDDDYEAGEKPSWIIGLHDERILERLKQTLTKLQGKSSEECLEVGLRAVSENLSLSKLREEDSRTEVLKATIITASVQNEISVANLNTPEHQDVATTLGDSVNKVLAQTIDQAENFDGFADEEEYFSAIYDSFCKTLASFGSERITSILDNRHIAGVVQMNLNSMVYSSPTIQ